MSVFKDDKMSIIIKEQSFGKMKYSLENVLYSLIIWYPALALVIAFFFGDNCNKLYIIYLLVVLLYYFKRKGSAPKGKLSLLILIFYILYTVINSGFYYVYHLDFYCFVGICFTFLVFSDSRTIEKFNKFLYDHELSVRIMSIWMVVFTILSVVSGKGTEISFGVTSMPVLYGPFKVPHHLAYMYLTIYAVASYFRRLDKGKHFWLIINIISISMIAWTAVRSAFLAALVLIFVDVIMSQNAKLKIVFLGFIGIVALFTVLNSGTLSSIPVIEKTLVVASKGSISNHRSMIWNAIIQGFLDNASWSQSIFGVGMERVRTYFGGAHGHNDYINALCGYGIVGLLIFMYCQLKPLANWRNFPFSLLGELFFFVLIFTNGFAMYVETSACIAVFFLFFGYRRLYVSPYRKPMKLKLLNIHM